MPNTKGGESDLKTQSPDVAQNERGLGGQRRERHKGDQNEEAQSESETAAGAGRQKKAAVHS